jgi:hypothetical protein
MLAKLVPTHCLRPKARQQRPLQNPPVRATPQLMQDARAHSDPTCIMQNPGGDTLVSPKVRSLLRTPKGMSS